MAVLLLKGNCMNNTTKLLLNHIVCHLMIVPAILYGELWMFLISFLWWYLIAIVSISGGYHRYYSHGAFKTKKWYPYVVNFLGLFSGAGPVLTWVGAHRMHHFYSDKEGDPHSYKVKGLMKVYLNTWGYDTNIERRCIKKIMKDKLVRWFYNHYFKLKIAVAAILLAIDPLLFIFLYAIPIVFAFHGYSILNTLSHRSGQPRNSFITNILTAGEGWHANHHEQPWNWKIGWKWWQFDPTAHFIRMIKV